MRLSDLQRTTSFRVALLFLLLFGLASGVLFGFLYWRMSTFVGGGVDDGLEREATSLRRTNAGDLVDRLEDHAVHDPDLRRLSAAFDPEGHHIAGNLFVLPRGPLPLDTGFGFTVPGDETQAPFRGWMTRRLDGILIFVSRDVSDNEQFNQAMLVTMAWSGVFVLLLGIGGGLVLGQVAVRRLDRVTGAIRRIVEGDLSGRLPATGLSGDVSRLVVVVNAMLDQIERLMGEVKGVCDAVAHDLRTPLTRLLAGLERAQAEGRQPGHVRAAAIDTAIVELHGILGTFTAMLRISEIEDGARRTGFRRIDLGRIARDVAELYLPEAEARDTALSVLADPAERHEMTGDPGLLFEALANLVENAIKFTPPHGTVTVRLTGGGGQVGVAVSDTGPGIPPEARQAVLTRFYRTERSRSAPGHGLGLSFVAAVAHLHRLDLRIDDAGPGCRVTLVGDAGITLQNGNAGENAALPVM